jgi:hypothetical protein
VTYLGLRVCPKHVTQSLLLCLKHPYYLSVTICQGGGTVDKQILINAKLKTGKRVKKTPS